MGATARDVDPPAGERYAVIREQTWQSVAAQPLSTFAVDIDSASYANVRRLLNDGRLPPADAVRVEELVNAFDYDYAPPAADDDAPFAAHLEVAAAPWAPEHRLVRIGLKGREVATAARAPANLVFLLDVSGSMDDPRKLPLVKDAMRLLLDRLRPDDRVAIVTYAGASGLVLPSTPAGKANAIRAALDGLNPGGSTDGAGGIQLAYDVARANFVDGGVNRIILCTDGDFNVGVTGLTELRTLIATQADSDVFLTTLGFGTGNYRDDLMEQLAAAGNGRHGYIDTLREARRLLVEQVEGSLTTIARDVKIQVEFNPAQVSSYRLIGYENRALAAEQFNDDAADGGEIGAGHTVTALYEVVPARTAATDALSALPAIDELRYQPGAKTSLLAATPTALRGELLTVKVRAQPPAGGESRRWEFPLADTGASFAAASTDFKFAAAVAGFGLVLRDSEFRGTSTFDQVTTWAESAVGADVGGWRREFIELVQRARSLAM